MTEHPVGDDCLPGHVTIPQSGEIYKKLFLSRFVICWVGTLADTLVKISLMDTMLTFGNYISFAAKGLFRAEMVYIPTAATVIFALTLTTAYFIGKDDFLSRHNMVFLWVKV